jgi:hypothetical protein
VRDKIGAVAIRSNCGYANQYVLAVLADAGFDAVDWPSKMGTITICISSSKAISVL